MSKKTWVISGPFVARRREMYESAAWQAAPPRMNGFLVELEIEHMRHKGAANGKLIRGYSQFVEAGFNRGTVAKLIKIAEALGFIRVDRCSGYGPQDLRDANAYTLTYLPTGERAQIPPTDDWKKFKTIERAKTVVKAATQECTAKPKKAGREAV